jgi:hypothetical protein
LLQKFHLDAFVVENRAVGGQNIERLLSFVPFLAVLGGVGDGFQEATAITMAKDEPIGERAPLGDVGNRKRPHPTGVHRGEPFAGETGLAVHVEDMFEITEVTATRLEEPYWSVAEFRGDFLCSGIVSAQEDFVGGIAVVHRGQGLENQFVHAAGSILVESFGGGEVVVKILERGGMHIAVWRTIAGDLPFEAGAVGLAFLGVDGQFAIAFHHDFPGLADGAEFTDAQRVELCAHDVHVQFGHGGVTESDSPFDAGLVEFADS